jgi:hypothetical protein
MLPWQKTQWAAHLPEPHAILLLAMNHEQITSAMGSVYGKKYRKKSTKVRARLQPKAERGIAAINP